MFTDEHRRTVWHRIRQHHLRAFAKWLSPELLTTAGKGPFYVVNVAWLAVAATGHGQDPLRLSFTPALRELQDLSQTLMRATPQFVSQVLLLRLWAGIAEHVVPERPGRHSSRPQGTKVRITGSGKRMLPSKLPVDGQRRRTKAKKAA